MGRFPITSSRGQKYIMVVYDFDSNAILAEPMKDCTATELVQVFEDLHNRLTNCGIQPKIIIMDNEANKLLKKCIKDRKMTLQLTAPDIHRINAANRAIRTFKEHFIAGLCLVDPNFQIALFPKLK